MKIKATSWRLEFGRFSALMLNPDPMRVVKCRLLYAVRCVSALAKVSLEETNGVGAKHGGKVQALVVEGEQ